MERHAIPDITIRESLARRGLECHLLREAREPADHDNHNAFSFRRALCAELKPIIEAAYKQELTEFHLLHETWAITLRQIEEPHSIAACVTFEFVPSYPCYFHTHFEAVHPDNQGVGLGRMLYDCLEAWTRFLSVNDPIVLHIILRANNQYFLVSTIDRDDPINSENEDASDNSEGHGAFLKKLGFVRAQHDFGQEIDSEIAFQREFAIPNADYNNLPPQDDEASPPLERSESIVFHPTEVPSA